MPHRSVLRSPIRLFVFFTVLVFMHLAQPSAEAATVDKVKGKSVLIVLEGMSVRSGDKLYAVDGSGKPKAMIQITKTSGDKALGKVTKGSASDGMEVLTRSQAMARKKTSGGGSTRTSSKSVSRKKSSFTAGVLFGMNMASMNVSLNGGATEAALSGSGTAFNAIGDFNLWDSFSIRASLGLEKFSGEGEVTDNSCTASGNTSTNTCTTSINYLALSALGRYTFLKAGSFGVWAGGGFALLNPSSSESTAVDVESIKTTTAIIVAGGTDYWLNGTIYFPLQVSYNLLPSSSDVSANYLALRLGVAYQF